MFSLSVALLGIAVGSIPLFVVLRLLFGLSYKRSLIVTAAFLGTLAVVVTAMTIAASIVITSPASELSLAARFYLVSIPVVALPLALLAARYAAARSNPSLERP